MDENDDVSRETEVIEEQGIPRFEMTLGGGKKYWATFKDPDLLTGKHLAALRRAYGSSENFGEVSNAFMALACEFLVENWELDGKQPPLPMADKSGKHDWRGSIPAKVLARLEQHIEPHLHFLIKPTKTDDGSPGSPHQPELD